MDVLECGICHIPYNEDDQRPRNSPCGHEFCTACLRALINDGEYVCPKCREKIKVKVVEDLPVNFGLVDVVRAFKAKTFTLTKEDDSRVTGASNEDVCIIHCKSISHWCSKCQLWICSDCLDSHTSLIGCSTSSATKAVEDLKDIHNTTLDQLLTKFKEDTNHVSSKIQEHTDKRKEHLKMAEKHSEEVKKLQNVLQQGNNHKGILVESNKHLNETNSPLEISERIKIMTQRKQTLLSWAAKNLGMDMPLDSQLNLLKSLKNENVVYVEKVIKDERRHSKLSQHDGNIYVHTFQTQAMKDRSSSITFDQLQKMIPASASLVFLELSLGDVVKGHVLIRLIKDLPIISKYVVTFFTGEHGLSFNGISLDYSSQKRLYKGGLPFKEMTITPTNSGRSAARVGDALVYLGDGYLQHLNFYLDTSNNVYDYGSSWNVFGNIEKGMEIMQECYDNHSLGVKISDCGLIIEKD